MVDKCEIKVLKSRSNYLTEWPCVPCHPWPFVRVAFSPDPVRVRVKRGLHQSLTDNLRRLLRS